MTPYYSDDAVTIYYGQDARGRPGWLKDPVTAAIVHLRHQNTVKRAPYFLRLADEAEEAYAATTSALAVALRERDQARDALRRASREQT